MERLKAKRLAEMQKNISSRRDLVDAPVEHSDQTSHRNVLLGNLGHRGEEVLRNAESQYPRQVPIIVDKLGQLIASGEINEQMDGGKLLALFRSVGIYVKMNTKINIEKDGKLVSLSDRLGVEDDDR